MPIRLRPNQITAVALCPMGANFDAETGDGSHVTLFKHDRPAAAPVAGASTANSASLSFVRKAAAAHPAEPLDTALNRYAASHPEEYEHVRRQTGHGTTHAYAAPAAPSAPVLKRADATDRLNRIAKVLSGPGGISFAEGVDLAAHLAPDLYAAHAGRPTVRKADTPPTADALEQKITEFFITRRGLMRQKADERAMQTVVNVMRQEFAALLNAWAGQ